MVQFGVIEHRAIDMDDAESFGLDTLVDTMAEHVEEGLDAIVEEITVAALLADEVDLLKVAKHIE